MKVKAGTPLISFDAPLLLEKQDVNVVVVTVVNADRMSALILVSPDTDWWSSTG